MKKICAVVLVSVLIIINLSACTLKKDPTYRSSEEKVNDLAKEVYSAILNHDSELLKEQFCEKLKPGKETAIDKIYAFLGGEIVTLETDMDNDPLYSSVGGGENRYDKRSKGFVFSIIVDTENGTRYKIVGKGDIINTIEPTYQGLQRIIIYRQGEDGNWDCDKYLDIGRELFREL